MLLYGSDKKRKNAVQMDSNINGFFWLSGNAQGQGHLTRLWCFDQALPPRLFSYGYWLCPRADFPPNSRMRVSVPGFTYLPVQENFSFPNQGKIILEFQLDQLQVSTHP